MKKHTAEYHDLQSLPDEAKALVTATADVVEEKVIAARERLSAALERGKEAWNAVQTKAVESAKATDKTIRKNPYQSIGVAIGVGALLGLWLARRK